MNPLQKYILNRKLRCEARAKKLCPLADQEAMRQALISRKRRHNEAMKTRKMETFE